MTEEIELKLALAPDDVGRLRRHEILRGLKNGPVTTRRLVSVYFDTPDLALRRKKVVLRIRRIGTKRIQTLKQDPLPGRSALVRGEWEAPAAADRPELDRIGDAKLRALVAPQFAGGAMRAVFVTDIRRTVWPLKLGRSEIACMLDIGEIRANGRRQPICELELELASGGRAALFRLARRLNRTLPLRVARVTKAERGYLLVAGRAPESETKAGATHLDPGMSVAEAFTAIARGATDHILANVDSASAGKNPEGVHQLRVGIRRLRNAFSLFRDVVPALGGAALARELRWLQRQLGPAREWDALLSETMMPAAADLDLGHALRPLRRAAERRRQAAYEQSRAVLREHRYTDLLLRLEAWFDALAATAESSPPGANSAGASPLIRFAAATLTQRASRVEKLGRKMRKIDDAELHKLRIRVKKLRYASEFFHDLWPGKATKRYIATLKSLQDSLGLAHDALIAVGLIGTLTATSGAKAAPAAKRLLAWNAARLERERKALIRLWHRFAATDPFWTGD